MHHVEEYNPTSVRPVRRSGSTSYNGQATLETSANHMLVSAQTPSNLDAVDVTTSPITGARVRSSTSYFPAVSTLTSHIPSQEVSQPPIETEHAQSNSVSPGPEQVESPSPPQPEQRPASPPPDPTKLSPPITLFAAPPHPRASHQRVNSRPSPPPFGGFSLGRPTSIASSASSHTRGPPGSSPASKTSPAMALTTSGDGSDSKYLPELQRRVPRKASSHSLSPAHDDLFRPSPLSEVSPPIEAANDSGVIKAKGAASGFAAIGSGPAGRLIRGFSITKKRTTSGAGVGPDGKPTALDMLRRFDGGGAS